MRWNGREQKKFQRRPQYQSHRGNNRRIKMKIPLKFMLVEWTVFSLECLLLVCSLNEHRFNVNEDRQKKRHKAHCFFSLSLCSFSHSLSHASLFCDEGRKNNLLWNIDLDWKKFNQRKKYNAIRRFMGEIYHPSKRERNLMIECCNHISCQINRSEK